MSESTELFIYREQIKGQDVDKLLDTLQLYAAVRRWHLFEAESELIRAEIKRRLTGEGIAYDQEEVIEGCTVQILTNTRTGETSVGWWRGSAADAPKGGETE